MKAKTLVLAGVSGAAVLGGSAQCPKMLPNCGSWVTIKRQIEHCTLASRSPKPPLATGNRHSERAEECTLSSLGLTDKDRQPTLHEQPIPCQALPSSLALRRDWNRRSAGDVTKCGQTGKMLFQRR